MAFRQPEQGQPSVPQRQQKNDSTEDRDPLAPARGILYASLAGTAIWVVVLVVALRVAFLPH